MNYGKTPMPQQQIGGCEADSCAARSYTVRENLDRKIAQLRQEILALEKVKQRFPEALLSMTIEDLDRALR